MTDQVGRTVAAPELAAFASIEVEVGHPVELSEGSDGRRRIVPITGGELTGSITGRVLEVGADYQVLRPDGVTELDARYAVELDDGTRLEISNTGVRTGSAEDIARLMAGEEVAPERIYFRCTPSFRAPAGRWEWMNGTIFIGTGERRPRSVLIHVWRVR